MTQIKRPPTGGDSEDSEMEVGSYVRYSGDVTSCKGYRLKSVRRPKDGIEADLQLIGKPANAYGVDVKDLVLKVAYVNDNEIRVHIYDKAEEHYQVPEELCPKPHDTNLTTDRKLHFNYQENPFAFWITRTSGEIIFDTRPDRIPVHKTPIIKDGAPVRDTELPAYPLVFSDQYLQLATAVPEVTNIYGLGDVMSTSGFRRDNHGTVQGFWNGDPAGNPTDRNLYGTHPFYLETRWDSTSKSSQSHGVFLRNSHGMDVILRKGVVEYRCLGGTLDLHFVAGPTPKDVIKQYSNVVGRPAQMPFWSFGFHLCRINYRTVDETREIVDKMREADVPLECMWNDFDYMDRKRNFTLSKDFPQDKFAKFLQDLHDKYQHYIPIVDAGMYKPLDRRERYQPYEEGRLQDLFIKNDDGSEYEGQVWGGLTVWPDWTHPKTSSWWSKWLVKLHDMVPFDGVWLDMNEPANLPSATDKWLTTKGMVEIDGKVFVDMGQNKWDYPPYAIHNGWKTLNDYTLAPSCITEDGYRHYNNHNLYGIQEVKLTRETLEKINSNVRPFILSRGNFAGQGTLSAHWLGDNYSTWESLRLTIQGVFQFQMFQMPMVGADVGGFGLTGSEELLNRWMQMGAFLPFYRNHNADPDHPQEPFLYPGVIKASRDAISTRYKLLPYWESLFAQANQIGAPPVRPLSWEFNDPRLGSVDLQFMVGDALLVTPCVHEDATTVKGHFPSGGNTIWRDWYTHEILKVDENEQAETPAPLGHIPLHLRSGKAIVRHTESKYTLTETKQCPLEVMVSLDREGNAEGQFVMDDGMSLESASSTIRVSVSEAKVTIDVTGDFIVPQRLARVVILGVDDRPAQVTVESTWVRVEYVENTGSLIMDELDAELNGTITLSWE